MNQARKLKIKMLTTKLEKPLKTLKKLATLEFLEVATKQSTWEPTSIGKASQIIQMMEELHQKLLSSFANLVVLVENEFLKIIDDTIGDMEVAFALEQFELVWMTEEKTQMEHKLLQIRGKMSLEVGMR